MSIQDLVDDFEFLGEWEDRYRYVIELGKELEPLSEEEHSPANKVEGCVSQVWLVNELRTADDGTPLLHFRGDSDAHIVRGLIAILMRLYSDKRPAEILDLDARTVFAKLGLDEHLTPQRSNGLYSMVARIQADAKAAADAATA
ncbi:SufE family protein [Parvibaculum sp.]|jgi:cysteine desulfuration protein SufE|uniref:SufE family protein n=1 Tax=Parvibaculum sp. TaxID=2024848 RepID=UPI001AFD021E|nr:SufE family protein [Parvibaculum sp.]MBO6635168.1 SufE family protein [Parvibaculum sp.]MBO6678596.1 SufE family protein [Parvibaculum sp.]MBO6684105.1 SufE family protein [Parvibaculum sp.]MBO6905468.1 SufE family protein [Parvibaculum sp.]